MVISVMGELINTKDIYQIGPVVGDKCWHHEEEGRDPRILTHSGYEFKIYFYNKITLTLEIRGNQFFNHKGDWCDPNGNKWWSKTKQAFLYYDYPLQLGLMKAALNEVRNEVAKYWNDGKNDIPHIELKAHEEKGE